jgi:colanic acid biosynthesis glycosyl transferase WcaI
VFIPQVPMSRIGSILRAAEALLVHLRDDPLFRITIPSKTQAYMAVGKPVIMAVPGDAARLVEDSGCGVVVKPEDPASLRSAIETLVTADRNSLASMAQAGRDYYCEHLSLRTGTERFATIFDRLIAGRSV